MQLQLEKDGYFLPSQITTVPKKWLFNYQGLLDESEIKVLLSGVANILSDNVDSEIINLTSNVEPEEEDSEFNANCVKNDSEEIDFNSIYYNPLEKSEKISTRSRKPHWSKDRMQKFISDCANNPVTAIQTMYKLNSPNTVYKYKHKFMQELNKA